MRSMMLAASLLVVAVACAQKDTSLTREFESLSAKERSRIARKEQVESTNDVEYQAVMAEADELFRQQRYNESLERFRVARTMRPYNVYPKVKIQDLTALIARRDEAMATQESVTTGTAVITPVASPEHPEVTVSSADTPKEGLSEPLPVVVEQAPREVEPVRKAPGPIVREPDPPVKERVVERRQPRTPPVEMSSAPPVSGLDGVSERVYKEGRAVVRERTMVVEGKAVVYRQVTHPWGETVHFKDGIAVPPRTWEESYPE